MSGNRQPSWLIWWEFKSWFHRCPECGTRPDRHYENPGPHWEDDKVAAMLGIERYGCPRCGHGSIEERDRAASQPAYTCPNACVEANHPGREHEDWVIGSPTQDGDS